MPKFPKPSVDAVTAAIAGGMNPKTFRRTGLQIAIDPGLFFTHGAMVYAKLIDRLGMQFTSWKEPLRQSLNQVVVPSIHQNFAAQGRPRWKALKRSTVQDRLMKGYPRGPILQRSGRLKRGATRKNIWEIRPLPGSKGADILRMRVNYFNQLVPYGQFHQGGARRAVKTFGSVLSITSFETGRDILVTTESEKFESKLPARPFIQIQQAEIVEIHSIFVSHLTRMVDKYWGTGSAGDGN